MTMMFQCSFKCVLCKFQGCIQSVSKVFQENFKEVSSVSKKFFVTWHSSQQPEQKEGLLIINPLPQVNHPQIYL